MSTRAWTALRRSVIVVACVVLFTVSAHRLWTAPSLTTLLIAVAATLGLVSFMVGVIRDWHS